MNMTITRILSMILTLCMMLTVCANIKIAPIDMDIIDGLIISDELVSVPDVNDVDYIDDEVIIMLANNEQTELMGLYYADSIAETTNQNGAQLDLGIDFTEIKLLNPSKQTATNELYSLEDTHNNIYLVKLDGISIEEALEILNSNPAVEIAEPNYLYEYCETPNDPFYSYQTALQNINANDAWNITTGSSDVVVGIIDSGIDGTHPEFVDNLWTNPYYIDGEGCSACSRIDDYHGYNFTGLGSTTGEPCGGIPTDIHGHGTRVAGIIGAKGNNGIGVCGVNWNVSLAWLGVHHDGGEDNNISNAAAIEALNYAENHNISIVNMSFDSDKYSELFKNAIENYSGLCVVSAGNNKANIDASPRYPSGFGCSNVISVAAIDTQNNLWISGEYGSNYGSNTVHVAAPGWRMYSTVPNGSYHYFWATSAAAPIVTGIAALIKSQNPDFTPLQIKAAICGTVQQMGKTYNVMYDGGIVDAAAAVAVTSDSIKTVTFNYNNNYVPNSHIDCVMVGQKVREPALSPQRTNYLFDGWYTSATGGVLYDFDTEITADITLYAHWSPEVVGSYGDLFPDNKFRNEVLSIINAIDNGTRTTDTIVSSSDFSVLATITNLNVSGKKIRDLSGVEYFTGLTFLDCSNNMIWALDVSMLSGLQELDCSRNWLIWISVRNLTSLKELNCSKNSLSSLLLKTVTSLETLNCSDNNLTALNTNTLINLQSLDCSKNELYTLDLNSTTHLITANCSHNKLTSLDISNSINDLTASYNKLLLINVNGASNISKIDVSNNEMNDRTDVIGFDPLNDINIIFGSQKSWNNNPYTDVSSTDYYYKAVQYVHENNIIEGESSTLFVPTKAVTRGELVSVLYTMAGNPNVTDLTNPFSDVSNSAEYLDAVKWAYNNGEQSVMLGTSSTIFDPNGVVSREMVAVVLERYANRYNISLTKLRDYETFADEDEISSWALDSVTRLYEACIFNGSYNGFNPTNTIIKGDLAILTRKFEVIRQYI